MFRLFVILSAFAILGIVCSGDIPIYSVPEPEFEVFSPKGLRVSIPGKFS